MERTNEILNDFSFTFSHSTMNIKWMNFEAPHRTWMCTLSFPASFCLEFSAIYLLCACLLVPYALEVTAWMLNALYLFWNGEKSRICYFKNGNAKTTMGQRTLYAMVRCAYEIRPAANAIMSADSRFRAYTIHLYVWAAAHWQQVCVLLCNGVNVDIKEKIWSLFCFSRS